MSEISPFPALKDDDLCRGRAFDCSFLQLPQTLKLHCDPNLQQFNLPLKLKTTDMEHIIRNDVIADHDGVDLTLDYARCGERGRFEEMLERMVQEGDNVGEDEFDEDVLGFVWRVSEIFTLKHRGKVQVFIALMPCLTSRTVDTCQVSPLIVYDTDWIYSLSSFIQPSIHSILPPTETKENIYFCFVNLAIQLVLEIKIGYTDCILRICPDSNPERVKGLVEKEGFKVMVDVPRSVLIKGMLLRDLVLVKNFSPLREPRSDKQVSEVFNKLYSPSKCQSFFAATDLKSVPNFPRIFFISDERMLFMRNFRKADADWLFELMSNAGRESRGYGLNEFPTISFFKIIMMLEKHCVVFHLLHQADTYKLKKGGWITNLNLRLSLKDKKVLQNLDMTSHPAVAGSFLSDSCHVRSKVVNASESCLIVDPKFRNQGLGKEFLKIEFGLMKDMGYDVMVNDSLTNNVQLRKALSNAVEESLIVILGSIPNTCYIKEGGWVGHNIQLCDFKKFNIF